ncbi:IgGFc-binding protein [Nannocystis sp. SCPEA4]|uniref:IgGFc-binding protein n=1 Tax=Nannocystis sp. SCPEA4 TaxID=2996787 RepID=UPI00226FBBC4|nr:IgGFc-binding protein [Nannocystis sp. SCPEA4]MCY1056281.1 IgGFc-binding protein [Nannocystis sp. SCPEA4]
MPRRLALLVVPLAVACNDERPQSSTTDATTALTSTLGPGLTTDGAPTTGPTSTGSADTTGTTAATSAATTGDVSATGTTGTTGEPACPADTIVCDGDTAQVCDGAGGFKSEEACPSVCVPGLGCAECVPGDSQCQGLDLAVCNDAGTGFEVTETCDELQGLTCDAPSGACVGACAGLGPSYIGCDYFPTVLQQLDLYNGAPKDIFAVAVANTANEAASVTITRGPDQVAQFTVAPTSVQVVDLPWIDSLTKGSGPSVLIKNSAYRLRSTRPVTVYQYNPLAATTTNDASLLLPVNTWTGNYLVASWPAWGGLVGFYAVVAREDGTTVTLLPSATGGTVLAGGGVAANGTGVVAMNAGDVLEVMTGSADLTGTIVQADKPVQVFGGHECTYVPLDVGACDHLEESMFPLETLATEYVVVPPVQVPNDSLDKAQVVRVVASEPGTTLTFSPDQPVNKFLAAAGDFVELTTTTAKFVVTADKKILVAQYMVGQSGGYGTSDPAMLLAVNPLQWRDNYLFHASTTWLANYVDIIAPLNAAVSVDGVAVGGWQPIGASQYQVAHVKLSNAGDGSHTITGDVGVGIGVYGVQDYGSYWYPGGLDLDLIAQ